MECLVPTRTDFKLCQPMVASSKKEKYLCYISFGITHPELESVPKHYLIAFFCKSFKKICNNSSVSKFNLCKCLFKVLIFYNK